MSNDTENILFLLKFGKKKHLYSLLNKGELYFNSPKSFNRISNSNGEQGDEYEGSIWIENLENIQISYSHPNLGLLKFNTIPGKLSKLTQYNHNYLTCSFYAITNKDIENSNIIKVDSRMLKFGEYVLVISNPKFLIDKLLNYSKEKNIGLAINKVEYKNLNKEGRIEMTPFIKKKEHFYQKEFRMVIKKTLETSKLIKIESLVENGKIISNNKLKELKIDYV